MGSPVQGSYIVMAPSKEAMTKAWMGPPSVDRATTSDDRTCPIRMRPMKDEDQIRLKQNFRLCTSVEPTPNPPACNRHNCTSSNVVLATSARSNHQPLCELT
mmetsp:Transcript_25742/g.66295  ORF Transcript_25742/g.66295 Transcript_25742/m.66295 type:complete len:102 (+) Transcript_25742:3391-3696(+)